MKFHSDVEITTDEIKGLLSLVTAMLADAHNMHNNEKILSILDSIQRNLKEQSKGLTILDKILSKLNGIRNMVSSNRRNNYGK